jgi:citrate lyase subunit beta/citryl-CoA lyase
MTGETANVAFDAGPAGPAGDAPLLDSKERAILRIHVRYESLDTCRTLLFVPGNRPRMLARAGTAGADGIVIDLEDAVPAREKASARRLSRVTIPRLAANGAPVLVRVNSVRNQGTRADLMAAVRPGLAGVVHPKTEHPQDLRDLDVLLREAEVRNKVRPGDTAVVPLIESPSAILDLQRIATAIDRVAALSLGGEDYTAALGVPRSDEALAYARQVLVTTAAACGIAAIDTPFPSVEDDRGLVREAKLAAALGFRGKYVIHPGQVAAVNKAFSPSAVEIAYATRVVEAARRAARQRKGVVSLDGSMIDAPVVARAERMLAMAERVASRGA